MFPTYQDVKDFAVIEADRLDAHDKHISGEHTLQNPELANEFATLRNNFVQTNKDLDEKLESMESSLAPFFEKVTALWSKLLGVSVNVPDLVKRETDRTKTDLQQKIDGVIQEVERKIDTLTTRLAALEKAKDTEDTEARRLLSQLDQKMQDKLEKASEKTLAVLERTKDNRTEFDKEHQASVACRN